MDSWLFPSVVASFFGSAVLALVYLYLYARYKQRYLAVWTISWTLYTARFIFVVLSLTLGRHAGLTVGIHLCALAAAVSLLHGTYIFLDKKMSDLWLLPAVPSALWVATGSFIDLPFLWMALPVFFYLGAVQIRTGFALVLEADTAPEVSRFTGGVLIAWGLHKWDYPFLRTVEWFAPWGFMIGAVLSFLCAMGILLIYFERNRKELMLKEQHHSMVLNTAMDGILVVDVTPDEHYGSFLQLNEAAASAIGYTVEELLEKKPWSLDIDGRKGFDSLMAQLHEDVQGPYERMVRAKDGRLVPMELAARVIESEGRKLLISTARDASRRKEFEELLAERELLFRSLVENIPGVAFQLVMDRTGKTLEYRYISEQAEDLIDPEKVEIKDGRGVLLRMVHPAETAKVEAALRDSAATGHPFQQQVRVVGRDGKDYWFQVNARVQPLDSERMLMTGAALDVSAKKLAEDDSRRTAGLYMTLVESLPDAVTRTDLTGRITFASQRALELYGIDNFSDFLGTPSVNWVHPSERHRVKENIGKVYSGERISSLSGDNVYKLKRGDGGTFYGQVNSKVLRDPDGTPTGMISVTRDVTDRYAMELDLRKAKDAAESADRAKSVFLANMSHEIRTPLNGIAGMLHLLKLSELENEQRRHVEYALESCKGLTQLLSDILDLSRIESGNITLVEKEFDLHETVKMIEHNFITDLQAKDLEFKTIIHDGTPRRLLGDSIRLRQVLFNLAGNAVKFTEQGTITLEISPLASFNGLRRIFFSVTDTGIGIPSEALADVFGNFTQAEGVYSRQFHGSGLGLSIVKRLVELMGGTLALNSEEGHGTEAGFTAVFAEPQDSVT